MNKIKLSILAVLLGFLAPITASAAFDTSLKYGMTGSAVFELQELLVTENCLSVTPTGYFGAMTLAGVKCFQTKHALPSTGYFGVMSRGVANTLVNDLTASSVEAEIKETGTTTPVVAQPTIIYQTIYMQAPTNTGGATTVTPPPAPVVPAVVQKPPLYPIVNGVCGDAQPCSVTSCSQAKHWLSYFGTDALVNAEIGKRDDLDNGTTQAIRNRGGLEFITSAEREKYNQILANYEARKSTAQSNIVLGNELVSYYCQ